MENRATSSKPSSQVLDLQSELCLTQVVEQDQILKNRVPNVKFVLVVLSAKGMVFDLGAMRQKIVLSYPDAAVFFLNTSGNPMGLVAPDQVDLVIDLSGPGQRQGFFFARKMRKWARVVVGRNFGLFRKRLYDRIFDEKENASLIPHEMLQRERFVQKKVLNLAGVALVQAGDTPRDQGKTIALELPSMQHL